ncbi:MAG: SufD family Fe-S cluster assembly protein [Pseudomonadota bacterium]
MSALLDQLTAPPLAAVADDLDQLRSQAQKVLMQHGFPMRKTEAWRYTPLALLERREWQSGAAEAVAPALELPFDGRVLNIHNGRPLTAVGEAWPGLELEPLRADRIDTTEYADQDPSDAFAWLNLARLEHGLSIRVTETQPLPLVLLFTSDAAFNQAQHPRIDLQLDPGVSITLIEIQRLQGEGLINAVLDVHLAQGAQLQHLMQRQSEQTALIARTEVRVGRNADYQAYVLDQGGALTRQDLKVALIDDHARAGIHGVAVLKHKQLVDYHTAIQHRVGPSRSDEDFRILADDHAMGVFNGRIHMLPGADDSHSDMNTANLLLSEHARINTKPELEIHAEEVTASHGATIGQLEDSARFYLRSRGLNDAQATALLKLGFAAAAFDDMPSGAHKDWFIDHLQNNL